MLVEFRVKNFRSIRAEQRFSLVADKDSTYSESHISESENKATPSLLKSAVIYGPNASGKSNLINALGFMREVVATSATQLREGQQFPCPPFRLDASSKEQPSEFELTFIDQGIRYQYGFSLMPERIMEEWLLVYKTSKPQMWFHRRFDRKNEKDEYSFGSHLTGHKALWQESTRANALFLSKAVDLNSERLRPIFLWIVEKLVIFSAGKKPTYRSTIAYAQTQEGKAALLRFLNAADLSIANLLFENRKIMPGLTFFRSNPSGKPSILHHAFESEETIPLFLHEAEDGAATFEIQDESTGTQRIFAFVGPVLSVLKDGLVLIVDELDISLHTLMVEFLITQFHSTQNNPKGAQLVFTTHDTSLLDNEIFRRDQIWFVEKDAAHATTLYPLTDFSPRKKEALGRGYLRGRYGALPLFTDFKL